MGPWTSASPGRHISCGAGSRRSAATRSFHDVDAYAGAGASSRSARRAVLRAVASARVVVDTTPRMATATPQPNVIHQPGWLAAANEEPVDPPATTIAPVIATPSDIPISRLV